MLPIGGVKQKVLAAHRAGLTEVIVPKRNDADLDDVPDSCREEMTFHVLDDDRRGPRKSPHLRAFWRLTSRIFEQVRRQNRGTSPIGGEINHP